MRRPIQPDHPLAGQLEGTEVPALIRELDRRSATGKLHVQRGPVKRSLFVENGRVVFASSSDPNDRLGEHLLRRGKITLHQLETVLTQLDGGERIGTLLVNAGILTEGELVEAVVDQIGSIVIDLLTWIDGTYRFEPGPPADEDILLGLTTEQLIYRGIREVDSPSLIERGLGTARTVYRLADDWGKRAERLDLNEGGRALLDRLTEGAASVDTLCREVCVSNFEICRMLWAFRLLGVAEPCERFTSGEPEGDLRTTSLAELMIRLEEEGATGMLFLSHGKIERSLLFAVGRCVFATSSDPDDGLVNFLFRRGVISLRDREETARRLLSNKRVGTILRELGAIDDEDLQQMVLQQVSEIVYDSFRWEDGEFIFVPGPLPHAEEITLGCGVSALIAEGTRRVASWTRLVRGCGGIDNPLCLTPRYLEVLDAIEAGVAEWEVVTALKSPQTPRRVCAATELNDFRVCQILWTLKLLGAIEDSPVEIDEAALAADVFPDLEVDPTAALLADRAATMPAVDTESAGSGGEQAHAGPDQETETVHGVSVVVAEREAAAVDEPPAEDPAPMSQPDASEGAQPATSDGSSDPVEASQTASAPGRRGEVEHALRSLSEGPRDTASPSGAPAARQTEVGSTTARSKRTPPGRSKIFSGPAAAPEWDVPQDVEEVILRFNAMHRVVYRAVRTEVGAGAVNFVQSCCARVTGGSQDPFEGVQLFADGSWDIEGLMRVIVEKGIDDPWEVYQSVLDEEFLTLQPHLGEVRADALKERIWEIERTAG